MDLRTFTPDHRHVTINGEINIPLRYVSDGKHLVLHVYTPDTTEEKALLVDDSAVACKATVIVKELLKLLKPSNRSVMMDDMERFFGIHLVETIRYPEVEGTCRNAGRINLHQLVHYLDHITTLRPGRASAHLEHAIALKQVLSAASDAGLKITLEKALEDAALLPKSREEILLSNLEASVKSLETTFEEHTAILNNIAVMLGIK